MIDSLTGQGFNVRHACRTLGVSESGYYAWKERPDSPRTLRRIWLAGEIADVHKASGGTYGSLGVTAELKYGRHISVGHNAVELIMRELGIRGLPTRRLPKGARVAQVTSLDLVRRAFVRDRPNQLWLTDITEHPTNEGKLYCCVVLDTFSRRVVGWSIDSTQTTALVLNALGTATQRREHRDGLVIHSDRGTQLTSWAYSERVRHAGIAPSMGAVGTAADNAMMESFWGRMQVELLDRRRWKTRIELASAIHDYIELWHNTRRRHSALGMLTPSEVEAAWAATETDAVAQTGFAQTAPTDQLRGPEEVSLAIGAVFIPESTCTRASFIPVLNRARQPGMGCTRMTLAGGHVAGLRTPPAQAPDSALGLSLRTRSTRGPHMDVRCIGSSDTRPHMARLPPGRPSIADARACPADSSPSSPPLLSS